MKKNNGFIRMMMVSGLLAAVLPAAGAFAEDRDAVLLAAQQQQAQIAAVAANPAGYIADLVAQWQPAVTAMGYPAAGWEAEFSAALKQATPEQLLAVKAATSYDAVRAILQGLPAPATVDGIGIQDLGDTTTDLTFTPVNPPCRIFDTRNVGGPVAAGITRNYLVYGSGAQMAAQGGNAAGCSAPKGEPVGVAANITAVPSGSAGHLRVFPFGAALPLVSYVNFTGTIGNNIANAGILSTCYLCASDLSVYNGSPSHSIGDIMGYFYPAQTGAAMEVRHGGYDNCCGDGTGQHKITNTPPAYIAPYNGNTTITVKAGDEVLVQYSAQVFGDVAGAVCGTAHPAYRDVAQVLPAGVTVLGNFETETDFGFTATTQSDMRSIQGSARVVMPVAGTFEFGMHAIKGATNCTGTNDYWITSKKISLIKVRRP